MPINTFSLPDIYQTADEIKRNRLADQFNQMQLADAQNAMQGRNMFAQAMQGFQQDPQGTINKLMTSGDPMLVSKGMELQGALATQQASLYKDKMNFYQPQILKALEMRDNAALQNIGDAMKKDPVITQRLGKDFSAKVEPNGDITMTHPVAQQEIDDLAVKYPQLASQIKGTPAGTNVKYQIKDGQLAAWEIQKPQKENAYDFARGALKEALRREPTDAEIEKHVQENKLKEATAYGEARAQAFGEYKLTSFLDTKNNNKLVTMTNAEFKSANKKEPGRFLQSSAAEKPLTRQAVITDIQDAIENTKYSIGQLQTDFTPAVRAKIALVMKDRNPKSAWSNFLGSDIAATLTDDQVNYLTDLAQLQENAMAMRSVLGAGQGSEDLRSAILRTIPSMLTPNKAYALKQLDKFNQQLNRLERGVPNVPLRTDTGKISNTPETGEGGLPQGFKEGW